jgi:hypothetical protein
VTTFAEQDGRALLAFKCERKLVCKLEISIMPTTFIRNEIELLERFAVSG